MSDLHALREYLKRKFETIKCNYETLKAVGNVLGDLQ